MFQRGECHEDDVEYMFPKTARQPISGEFVGQRRRIPGLAIRGDVGCVNGICLSEQRSVHKICLHTVVVIRGHNGTTAEFLLFRTTRRNAAECGIQ